MAPRGVGSLVAMPIIGLLMNRVDPRRMLALGFLVNGLTMFWMSGLNLEAGYWDIFWPQFVQGIGMGMLFVPLTTVAMDRISRADMGQASSLFNLLRNIGGSVGIALIETSLARDRQAHTNMLGAHVTAYSASTQSMFDGLRAAFVARGSDVVTATSRAQAALFGMVQQQAAMLSFLHAFQLLAVVFVVMTPLVFLMKKPRHHESPAPIAGE
jgi:DHA2 family multidrug resistance protein